MRTTWTFHSAGQLVFGPGAAAQLGELARGIGLRRILIATDTALVQAGLLAVVSESLREAAIDVEVFEGGEPEPSFDAVERCLAQARQVAPDGMLGLGGGSNMDLAKAVSVVLAHGGTPGDWVGDQRAPGPVLPLICVPTTAGTGSEVTAAAVLTDTANHMKVGLLSNFLRPRLAIVDPRLTLSCPRKVTADSGIDALTHAIEAYTAVDNESFPLPPGERTVYQGRHPLGDCLAEKSIELAGQNLARAVEHGDDLDARTGMSLAATLAGLAFSNVGVALVHALEYPIGGATHCSHGAGNGLLLPHVMRFNLKSRPKQFARIAQLLGEDVYGMPVAEAGNRAIGAVEQLNSRIGIPVRLRDLGARRDQLAGFAEKAASIRRILRVNPRPVSVEQALAVYEAAW